MANSDPSLVNFGKNIVIDTKVRKPEFDNGNSLAYEARENSNNGKKYVAIIAGPESLPRWSAIRKYQALIDTSFVRLIGSGVLFWPLLNRRVFVLMYDVASVAPLMKNGVAAETHWRHPDIVELFVAPMANMFKELEDKSFAHGAIRPENIFYSPTERGQPIILGDCLSVQPDSTQDAVFLPPSKALAEPFGRGRGSVADDIYAFGVSLLFFLRKHNEIEGLSDEEVVKKKLEYGSYTALIGKERFQVTFLELLKGVLCDDPEQRWDVNEIFAWLDGARLTPMAPPKKKKATRPFSFSGKKYMYAELLAMDLPKDPGALVNVIDDGSLEHWVTKSVDDEGTTLRFFKALDRVGGGLDASHSADELVSVIAVALNPLLPVRYKGRSFTHDGLGGLLAIDAYNDRDLSFYKDAINRGVADHAVSNSKIPQQDVVLKLKIYDMCRGSLKKKILGHGMEKCIYMLCPDTPCLSPTLKDYFVNGKQAALLALEDLSKKGKQTSIMLDHHLTAFFSVQDSGLVEGYLYDLNSGDKGRQVAGNLHFMAAMQRGEKFEPLTAMAAVFLESLGDVYMAYKNKTVREEVEKGVRKAAEEGNLIMMSALIDNQDALSRDHKGFRIATAEYKMLQKEYNAYNKKMANKKTYGVTNGHDTAAVVSWFIATAITVLVVLSFLSGNKIF